MSIAEIVEAFELPGEPDIFVRLTSSYYSDRLERMIRDLAPVLSLAEPRYIVIDLGGLAGIGPAALALLVAALHKIEAEELVLPGTIILPPTNPQVRNYIMRMDFLKYLAGGDQVRESFDRKEETGFRPCQRFADLAEGQEVARDLTEALSEQCEVDRVAHMSMHICLSELNDNVFYHAGTEHGGFALAQHWRSKNMFEIGLADLGIGVRSSLRKNPLHAEIEDDLQALRTAMRPRVTSTPERNSGIGLFVTQMLLAANGGTVVVRSGTAEIQRGARTTDRSGALDLPGTIVSLQVRTDRPLNIKQVYREFKDVLDDDDDNDDDGHVHDHD